MPNHHYTGGSAPTVPPGKHVVLVTAADQTLSTGSKTSNSEMIVLSLQAEKSGVWLKDDYLVFCKTSKPCQQKINKFLAATTDLSPNEDVDITPEFCKGLRGMAVVGDEKWKDRVQSAVTEWVSLEEGEAALPRAKLEPLPDSAKGQDMDADDDDSIPF